MIKILLIEDDDYDSKMTIGKLGKDCQITLVKTTQEGFKVLEEDQSFDYLLYDYGAGGLTLEEKKESFDKIADICNRFNISITVLSGAKIPDTILQAIKNKGGEFRTKNEVKESLNPNSLMSLLGMEYLTDKTVKDKERSITVRKIEQELVKFNVEIQQVKERFISELNQVKIKNSTTASQTTRISQRNQIIETKINEMKKTLDDYKEQSSDRMESIEQNLIDLKYRIDNLTNNKSATITTAGVVIAAMITGFMSILVIFVGKK